jgi:hypothetical protein
MFKTLEGLLYVRLASEAQREQLRQVAARRNWGLSLLLVGWLHLLAFSACYYLTIVRQYHQAPGYLAVWVGELCGLWLIFRLCGGPRRGEPAPALELLLRRVWTAYFILAFNLGSLNTLRGNELFEFFPAMASLASFAFLVMAVTVNWRFLAAVLVMFGTGLLMAAHFLHAYLFFALAWWLVLNGIGLALLVDRRRCPAPAGGEKVEAVASTSPRGMRVAEEAPR